MTGPRPAPRIANAIVLAWGWRRALIALVAGSASALAMAPVDAFPVMFLTLPVAALLIDGSAAGRWNGIWASASAGWFFGFGYFLAGLYWVGYAFLVDAKTFGWLMPFAVTALPAGLALFMAFGFALARVLWTQGPTRILALAAALTVSEWLRGHILTGFPWNALGDALTGFLPLAQTAAYVGVWGLTFLAVAIFTTPVVLADAGLRPRQRWMPFVCGVVVLVALAGAGVWRLSSMPTQFVDGVKLRLIQPNLQQDEKFNYSAKDRVMAHYLALSDRATGPQSSGIADVTHLIWPESAFPFFLTREADAMAKIADLLPPQTTLITGAVRAREPVTDARHLRAYNSIYVIGGDGTILSVYDKVHLVPFGEYLPFQNFLERLGLQQLTKLPGGFLAGDRHRSIAIPGAPRVLPLLCYEIIFTGDTVPLSDRPGWIVNLTNDGWFGISSGPYQHFLQARVRAIEEGLPVVRDANDGISAVIDPLGRVVNSLPLGVEGVLDSGLPKAIAPTWYERAGDSMPGLMILVALAVLIPRRRRRA